MKILNPIPVTAFVEACSLLVIAPGQAISDPAWCLRIAASAPVEAGQAFACRICAPGTAPDLSRMSPDESALAVALLWIRVVDLMRREIRSRATQPEPAFA